MVNVVKLRFTSLCVFLCTAGTRTGATEALYLVFIRRGRKNMGIDIAIEKAPMIMNPSHQAPINRGSSGDNVVSERKKKEKRTFQTTWLILQTCTVSSGLSILHSEPIINHVHMFATTITINNWTTEKGNVVFIYHHVYLLTACWPWCLVCFVCFVMPDFNFTRTFFFILQMFFKLKILET